MPRAEKPTVKLGAKPVQASLEELLADGGDADRYCFIQAGASPTPGVVLLAVTVGDNEDDPEVRVLVGTNGAWLEWGFAGDVPIAIEGTSDGRAWMLGMNSGTLIAFDWRAKTIAALTQSRRLIENPMVGDLGPLRCMRVLGNDLVLAGTVGQLYVLDGDAIRALPRLPEVEGDDAFIEGLCGTSARDVTVASVSRGVATFDGATWTRHRVPGTEKIDDITRLADGTFAVCGGDGVSIGRGATWRVIAPRDRDVEYYGVAEHGGKIYAAWEAGLDVVTGKRLVAVADGTAFAKLDARPHGVFAAHDHNAGFVRDGVWAPLEGSKPKLKPKSKPKLKPKSKPKR